MKKYWLTILTIIVIGALGYTLRDIYLKEETAGAQKSNGEPMATSFNGVDEESEDTAPQTGENSASVIPPTGTTNSEAFYLAELIDAAIEGDQKASYELYRITVMCNGLFTPKSYAYVKETYYADMKEEYVEWKDQRHEYCSKLDMGEFNNIVATSELLKQNQHPWETANDVPGVAREQGFEFADSMAISVIESGNADAIAELLPYLVMRDSTYDNEYKTYAYQPEIRDAAFVIFACELGWSACLPESEMMWGMCGRQADQCSPHDDLVSLQSQYVWPPATYREARDLSRIYYQHYAAGEFLKILHLPLMAINQ